MFVGFSRTSRDATAYENFNKSNINSEAESASNKIYAKDEETGHTLIH